MKSPYVCELQENSTPSISLLVQSKEIRQKKTGEPYLSMILSDRTGDIEAKMWDNVADILNAFERDDFVRVKGLVQIYHNRVQLVVHRLRPMEEREVDFADYFPASKHDPAVMWSELQGYVNCVGNLHIRGLLNAILDDEEIARRYRIAPAAKQIHHAFLSGLLEHVLSLCRLSRLVGPHYSFIDCDLLIAGAILHDLGKIYELSYDRGFTYTPEGQLLGHMMIGLRIVADKLRAFPDFPPALRTLIEHIIISHHGQLDYGSPKVPQFPEAILFHYLDDLDSKMECTRSLLERDQTPGAFTAFSHAMERGILKKAIFLEPAAPSPPPAAPEPQRAIPATAPATAAPPLAAAAPSPAPPKPPVPPVPARPVSYPSAAPLPPSASPRPHHAPPPPSRPDSPFATKLLEALRPEK
ncbi:MAG TPA: OB-fold nucleic acid binding domain-containing protein [Bryobacteraceae bacterium]|jgi:3'-5' exoribonuclease